MRSISSLSTDTTTRLPSGTYTVTNILLRNEYFLIRFCIPKIFKWMLQTGFWVSTKSPFEFVFSYFEFTKVIL